ncbi:hypothetical protein HYU96_04265 [Candidatus Daviesbacteria bacterium]|nr:hypothetical protein [Candidatus Daviesbacteria bacterium]
MIVAYDPAFLKKFKKADVRIRKSFKERILLFSKNPNDLILNNHKLRDEYKGYNSIDITSDWRALYIEKSTKEDTVAYFAILGTHDHLFRKRKNLNS